MQKHCLKIIDLNKQLSTKIAMRDVNLSLASGKKVALLGCNGAGKSSFIRLLVGESRPEKGELIYRSFAQGEEDLTQNLHPQNLAFKKRLGYQSDTMLAITEMTGQEYFNLCGNLKNLSQKTIEAKIGSLAKQWNIESLLEQPMSSLSKGNLQKLAIIQVFIAEPRFLFFDEPCQSLDPLEQDRFNQHIKHLADFDLCLFSTHNVDHALEVADEIILFHQAKIAYHFRHENKDNYLLVCKEPNCNLQSLADSLDLKIDRISQQVYQLHTSNKALIATLEQSLRQAQLTIEFCLPEVQSVMPLFRLLASGEIE